MVLLVNAVRNEVLCPNLMLYVEDYEGAFEALNKLIRQGFQLLEASLRDEDNRLRVPVEAFDGQPVQVHLRSLQVQWQQLLTPSQDVALKLHPLREWLIRLDAYYDTLLIHLQKMIVSLQIRKRNIQRIQNAERRTRFACQLGAQLASNQRMYQQTLQSYHHNQARIQPLSNPT